MHGRKMLESGEWVVEKLGLSGKWLEGWKAGSLERFEVASHMTQCLNS